MIPKHINYFTRALVASRRSSGNLLLGQTLHCSHVAAYYFHLDEIELDKVRQSFKFHKQQLEG